jgi:hypothetical protein
MKRKLAFVIAAAAAALVGGAAYATIPDGQGTIHACYKTENGQLRVVDADPCHPSETALTWNQTGPQGPPGPPGADSTKTVSGAINPDGTSQLATDDFTTQKLGTGHYRIEFAPGTFTSIPNLVVMPIGKLWVSGSIEFPLGGGKLGCEYFTVGIDSNQLTDSLVNFIATPFTQG